MRRIQPISRRTLLRGGTAVALALPWLEAMQPREASAHGGAPLRFVAFFTPNGMPMADWTPQNQGADYDLPPALADLGAVQPSVSVLTGLQNTATNGAAGHAPSTAGFLTGTAVNDSQTDLYNRTSVDQVYAQSVAGRTPQSSLVLGMIGGAGLGQCDGSNYGCAYLKNISWTDSTPIPKITTPQVAFDLLFAGSDPDASPEEIALRRAKRLSVLDSVLDEAESLQSRLGQSDRHKIDEYLDAVRDLELRVESEEIGGTACTPIEPGAIFDTEAKTLAMLDIIAMALRCDQTRAITFMCGEGLNSLDFTHLGVSSGHHGISHNLGSATNKAMYLSIAQWEVRMFAHLVETLAGIDEGGTSVLDNSVLYFGNEISSGGGHTHTDLPVLLAGSAGGAFTPGRHVVYGSEPPVANLFIAILGALGVAVTSFGDDGNAALGQL